MKRPGWRKILWMVPLLAVALLLFAGWMPEGAARAAAPDALLYAGDMPDEGQPAPPQEPSGPVAVTGVQLDQETVTVAPGKKVTLKAFVLPENADNRSVNWKSSNKSIATVNKKGVVKGLREGKVTITAVTSEGRKKAQCVVYVGTPVTKVRLNQKKAKLTVGANVTLEATVKPENATNAAVVWASSNESVATVSTKGKVKARAPGKANITVTTKDGGKSAKFVVTVYPQVESVSLKQGGAAELRAGEKMALKATVLPAEALDKSLVWKSSKTKVATVSAKGKLTALAAGKTTITATAANGVKVRFTLTVTNYTLFKGRNRVTSPFQSAQRPDHNGIDVVGMDGDTIYATVSGRVRWARMVERNAPGWGETWQWGYFVWIEAEDGTHHIYAHMAAQPKVKEGARVQVGQAIGVMGNTGYSFGTHTHYEVRKKDGRTPINPAPYAGLKNQAGVYG